MALRGLKITGMYCYFIHFLFNNFIIINLKIVHFCYFQNTFPFVSTFRETDVIRKERRIFFVEQGIGGSGVCVWGGGGGCTSARFKEEEIKTAINKLKNNKEAGVDNIMHISNQQPVIYHHYMLNMIFDSRMAQIFLSQF